jgi:thiamine transport system ATP-binding protein
MTVALQVRDARVTLGGHPALAGVGLDVAAGTTVAVLGPSGSGKSTLLRAIAGLQRLDEGEVTLDGRALAGVPAHRRGVGLMFQDDALFPHRDVAANVAFGLRMQSVARAQREGRVRELLALVGLEGREHRRVSTLSGGERKRVALARALAPAPRLLLLDEPLGALDRPLHDRLVIELRDLFAEIGQTALYVTHDVGEAFALGARVAVMRRGAIVQVDQPESLWAAPTDAWVARFIGLANVEERGAVSVVTRPDGVVLRPDPQGEAIVVSSQREGPVVTLRARYDDGRVLVSAHTGLTPPEVGMRVAVEIADQAVVEVPTTAPPAATG